MKRLKITQFGNPILRQVARRLDVDEIAAPETQKLIADMRDYLNSSKKYGVGLAAPQVGQDIALSIIEIKPTPYRPNAEQASLAIINPEIVEMYGRRAPMWEGCISFGTSRVNFPYAQTVRYKKIRLKYFDERGVLHAKDFEGLLAHVIQHEVDHLNGVLFVDRVKDTSTYMMKTEFVKRKLGMKK
jgi:peptide deformylase